MPRIPATVITGFLGAGKTTLVRSLLRQCAGRRLALVVNEFGDLGVDGSLLESCPEAGCATGRIVELANGCLCCTVADDFLPAMRGLLALDAPPEHILIETSGLALPKPLVRAFAWPEVRTRLTVDGVVAVVDAPAVRNGRFAPDPAAVEAQRRADTALDHDSPLEELFEEQLGSADLVVLTKADLMAESDWPGVEAAVRAELRPGVGMVRASTSAPVPASVLLGLGAAAEDDLASRPSHHDDGSDHEHDDFESFVVDLGTVADPGELAATVAGLGRLGVLRAKGFAGVDSRPMRLVLQGVGERVEHYFDRPWRADEPRGGRLVVIGLRGLDRPAIQAALAARAGTTCTS